MDCENNPFFLPIVNITGNFYSINAIKFDDLHNETKEVSK